MAKSTLKSPRTLFLFLLFHLAPLPSSSFLLSPSRSLRPTLRSNLRSNLNLRSANDDDDVASNVAFELSDEGVADDLTDQDIMEMQELDDPITRTLTIIGVNNPFSVFLAATTLMIIILNNVLGVGWLREYSKSNGFNDEGAAQVQKQVVREPPIGSDLARDLDKIKYERREIEWGNTNDGEVFGEAIIPGKTGDGGGWLLPFRKDDNNNK